LTVVGLSATLPSATAASRSCRPEPGADEYGAYTYLGANTIVKVTHPEVTDGLELTSGSSGSYPGLDRFGRANSHLKCNTTEKTGHRGEAKLVGAMAASVAADEMLMLLACDPELPLS